MLVVCFHTDRFLLNRRSTIGVDLIARYKEVIQTEDTKLVIRLFDERKRYVARKIGQACFSATYL